MRSACMKVLALLGAGGILALIGASASTPAAALEMAVVALLGLALGFLLGADL